MCNIHGERRQTMKIVISGTAGMILRLSHGCRWIQKRKKTGMAWSAWSLAVYSLSLSLSLIFQLIFHSDRISFHLSFMAILKQRPGWWNEMITADSSMAKRNYHDHHSSRHCPALPSWACIDIGPLYNIPVGIGLAIRLISYQTTEKPSMSVEYTRLSRGGRGNRPSIPALPLFKALEMNH